MSRYALKGDAYNINIFFDNPIKHEWQNPYSEFFVGSVYNFRTGVEECGCGNCKEQHEDGILSTAQIPATLPRYYFIPQYKKDPVLQYVVVNSLGEVRENLK